MGPLIPTTRESHGVQRFVYRAVFPLSIRVTEDCRILKIAFSTDYLRREEILYLLSAFGFSLYKPIETTRDGRGRLIFRQELIVLDLPETCIPKEENVCCRYFIDDAADELLPYFEAAAQSRLTEKMVSKLARPLKTRGEIFPTDMVPVLARSKSGSLAAFPMVWGFRSPVSSTPIFNARSESAGEKPMFRESWQTRRCVIPASCFFEWAKNADKTKYAVQPKGASSIWMAGLYRYEQAGDFTYPVFTILTGPSAGDMARIHERMPILLPYSQIDGWMDPANPADRILKRACSDLVIEEA